jgi:hypothetical protein
MTKPMIKIVELDGTIINREMTDDEFAQHETTLVEIQQRKAEKDAKAQAKAELLERLGITADEAKLLLA